jgi:hypothetical protein
VPSAEVTVLISYLHQCEIRPRALFDLGHVEYAG